MWSTHQRWCTALLEAANPSMMDHAIPIWTPAHVWKLQVLQSKFLKIATSVPQYGSNQKIYSYMEDPLLAIIIRTPRV